MKLVGTRVYWLHRAAPSDAGVERTGILHDIAFSQAGQEWCALVEDDVSHGLVDVLATALRTRSRSEAS